MKALLMKDAFVLYKQLKLMLITLIFFCMIPGVPAVIISVIYIINMPVYTLSYDERSKWNQLALMMPYTARQIVFSKYLLGYIGAGAVAVLSLTFQLVFRALGITAPQSDILLTCVLIPIACTLLFSLLLPVMIRFGTEKGRMIYIVMVAILAALSAGFMDTDLSMPQTNAFILIIVMASIAGVCNLFSIRLSVRFFERQKS